MVAVLVERAAGVAVADVDAALAAGEAATRTGLVKGSMFGRVRGRGPSLSWNARFTEGRMLVAVVVESADGVAVAAAGDARGSRLVGGTTEQEAGPTEDLASVSDLEPSTLVDETEGLNTELTAEAAAVDGDGVFMVDACGAWIVAGV